MFSCSPTPTSVHNSTYICMLIHSKQNHPLKCKHWTFHKQWFNFQLGWIPEAEMGWSVPGISNLWEQLSSRDAICLRKSSRSV